MCIAFAWKNISALFIFVLTLILYTDSFALQIQLGLQTGSASPLIHLRTHYTDLDLALQLWLGSSGSSERKILGI